jgi:hypothetical protein
MINVYYKFCNIQSNEKSHNQKKLLGICLKNQITWTTSIFTTGKLPHVNWLDREIC